METDFLPSGYHFFFSIFRRSCHCQLYFPVRWERILKQDLLSGQWKRIFWQLKTILFIYFLRHFCQIFSCLVETYFEMNPSFWLVEKDFLANWKPTFPIFQILLIVKAFFPGQCKLIFQQILHFVQLFSGN